MRKQVKIVATVGDKSVCDKVKFLLPDGSEIPNVFRVEWCADVMDDIPHAKIYTHCTEVDIETGADIVAVCPMCKKEIEETVVGAIERTETEQAGE